MDDEPLLLGCWGGVEVARVVCRTRGVRWWCTTGVDRWVTVALAVGDGVTAGADEWWRCCRVRAFVDNRLAGGWWRVDAGWLAVVDEFDAAALVSATTTVRAPAPTTEPTPASAVSVRTRRRAVSRTFT